MGEDRITELKKEIRSVLITFQDGVSLPEFCRTYKNLVGEVFPSRKLGYSSDIDFLRTIPDVVHIFIEESGNYKLFCIADEKSKHIQKLVHNQRLSKPKFKFGKNYLFSEKFKVNGCSQSLPFIPATLRVEINRLMQDFPDGITFSSFFLAYKRLFKKPLNLAKDFETLEKIVYALPELEIKIVKNERKIFHLYFDTPGNKNICKGVGMNSSFGHNGAFKNPSTRTKNHGNYFSSHFEDRIIDKSGISNEETKKLAKVLKLYPEGVLAVHFPALYEKVTGEVFELYKFGYNSILELADSLPDVFARKLSPGTDRDWILLPANIPTESYINEESSPKYSSQKSERCIQNVKKLLKHYSPDGVKLSDFLHLYKIYFDDLLPLNDDSDTTVEVFLLSISDIVPLKFNAKENVKFVCLTSEKPAAEKKTYLPGISTKVIDEDVVNPMDQYIQPPLLVDLSFSEYVPVFISSIINPGLFWFQLQTQEAVCSFEKLESELESFYNSYLGHKYKMNDTDIMIGATCVALCPTDGQWYRVVIKSVPTSNNINVSYVDYGGSSNIPRSNLRYLKKSLLTVPAHAFEAHLACLKPSKNEPEWSIESQKRFIQLCKNITVMAQIQKSENGSMSIYLCDTNGDQDLHINDALIHEGHAEFCSEENFNVKESSLPLLSKNLESLKTFWDNLAPSPSCSLSMLLSDSVCSDKDHFHDTPKVLSDDSFEEAFLCSDISEIQSSEQTCTQKEVLYPKRNADLKPKNLFGNSFEENACENNIVNKRYVKRIKLGDGYISHIIVVGNKPFVSGGDVSALLWDNKDVQFLTSRLTFKETVIPTLIISSDDFETLFQQCQRFSVKGIQETNTNNLSLTMFPLDSVVSILNTFGHPSVLVREAFYNEMKRFDPFDQYWNVFSESDVLENTDKDVNGVTDKMKKLCLYDLKAMHEGLNCKKLKIISRFENVASDYSDKEVERIENVQSIISKRIKHIEAICSSYS